MKSTLYLILLSLILCNCTATRWAVIDETAVDNSDFELINSRQFLSQQQTVTPDNPTFRLVLLGEETYEFSERVQVQRTVQRYKPRLGFFAAGLVGAGAAFYAANSSVLTESPSRTQSVALHAAGIALGALSFLNMKPNGEPAETGETRLLRKTGTFIQVDTVKAVPPPGSEITLAAFFKNEEVIPRRSQDFSDGILAVNLANEISPELFSGTVDEPIRIEVSFDGNVNNYFVSAEQVFQPFIQVNTELSPLRNNPENNIENVLIDLARGSQLQLIEPGTQWHRVRYGNIETFISARDVDIFWRPSEFAQQLSVVEVPFIPFGNVDVENNIPALFPKSPNRSALLIANQNYDDALLERPYSERDARLIEEYLLQSLGFTQEKITSLYNFDSADQVQQAFEKFLDNLSANNKTSFIFLSGHVFEEDDQLYLAPVRDIGNEEFALNLHEFFDALAEADLSRVIVVADLNFSALEEITGNSLYDLSSELIQQANTAVIFGSAAGQSSNLYMSANREKKYHYIFPYFFADAIKKGKTTLSEIVNHLDLNVSYVSRRLHDKPQDIRAYGNLNLNIAGN